MIATYELHIRPTRVQIIWKKLCGVLNFETVLTLPFSQYFNIFTVPKTEVLIVKHENQI